MTVVWIILAIALSAVVIGSVLILRRRIGPAPEHGGGKLKGDAGGHGVARAPAGEAKVATKPTPAARAERPVIPEPVVKPAPSARELKAEVEGLVSESERLLGKLKALGGEGDPGEMIGLLDEALAEVKSLTGRNEYAQARDKAEALKSQLAMMVSSARGEAG